MARRIIFIGGGEVDVRLLVDLVVTQARWLAHLGDKAYTFALWVNTVFNKARRLLGFPYWSLSKWAKLKVKNAVSYIGEFEKTLAAEAKRHGADGVICGHIHQAVIHDDFGLRYINVATGWKAARLSPRAMTAGLKSFAGPRPRGCGRQRRKRPPRPKRPDFRLTCPKAARGVTVAHDRTTHDPHRR